MTTDDLMRHMIEASPWVNPDRTVDNVKTGNGDKPIGTVAVCWFASLANLRRAVDLGCDALFTHEPTWWDHVDAPGGWRDRGPGLEKTRLLEESGMAVARLHDTWDNWPKLGIRDSFARGLGLDHFLGEDETRWHATYQVPEQTLREFAVYVASRVAPLGESTVQVMGDPDKRVSRPSVGVGCGGPAEDMIEMGSDVLIVCFDGAGYWSQRDRFLEQDVGVIALEHGTTEMWGMESLAGYIGDTWPDLTVHHLTDHWKPWHASA